MKKGIDVQEVLLLAKTMEIKFTVSGPAIGGAKSGINFDPADPRKSEVLYRWYNAISPLLRYCYGTGGDLNVDYIHEVVPITRDLGDPASAGRYSARSSWWKREAKKRFTIIKWCQ